MQKAIYVSKTADLNLSDRGKFTQLYFGAEFCERLLPSPADLNTALDFAKSKNMNFTFVSPYLTDKGMETAKKLISMLPEKTEVVFNDWGLLSDLNKMRMLPVMGRLLVKHMRDPAAYESQNKDMNEYFMSSNLQSNSMQKFLALNGITRVELDNKPQGFNLEFAEKTAFSLYYPFVHLTTTRRCLANKASYENPGVPGAECKKECLGMLAKSKHQGHTVYTRGNAQFYVNKTIPPKKPIPNLNRLVYSPKLPV